MKPLAAALFLTALAVSVTPVAVADDYFAHTNCKDPETQMEMDYCAGQDFKAADAKLNALYDRMMAKYDAADKEKLRASERAWLAYRDAECDYENAPTENGSIHSSQVIECRVGKTLDRIKELETQRDCIEGNMTCNRPD